MGPIRLIINLYIWVIIIDSLLSYFPQVRHQEWAKKIKKAADFGLDPIRKMLPRDLMLDPAPLILIIILNILITLW